MSNRGKNPNSLKALNEHRNRSGQRNRAAVQFARSLRELIVKEGETTLTIEIEGKKQKHQKIELMIRQLWNAAIKGEPWAVQFIAERVEGKITQPVGEDPNMPFDSKIIPVFVHDDNSKT